MAIGDRLAQANIMTGGQGAAFGQMFVGAAIEANIAVFLTQRVADGATSAGLTVPLPLNAVVKSFDVVVQAQQASFTFAKDIAQLRDANQEVLGGDGMAVVIDFGTLRTVSAVQVPSPLQVMGVTPWIGMGFAPEAIYATSPVSSVSLGGEVSISVQAQSPSTDQLAFFDSEVRTERLLVTLVGGMALDELAAAMSVLLPEAPSGLDLSLEGGASAWAHPAAPQITDDSALSDAGWNKDAQRIVHVGPALAAVTGDPTRAQTVDFTLTLTSRVPGKLAVTEHARAVSIIRRVLFDGDPARTLDFASEGAIDLPLPLPEAGQSRAIEAVRFTAVATPPPERVLPPVGPDPAGGAGVPVLADIVLSAGRAAIVRLRPDTGLGELTGIRLPLRPAADGAEARVVLWHNREPGLLEPAEALPDGTSDPVALQGGTEEAWITFPFPRPVPLDDADPPWAALLVSRGEAVWSLGAATGPEDPLHGNVVRIGPPTGPWKALPAPFQSGGGPLAALRGRVRAVGLAPKDRPLAPLWVSAAGAGGPPIEVTPSPKGVQVAIAFDPPLPVAQPVLRITGLTAGAVTLRDIDVVSTS